MSAPKNIPTNLLRKFTMGGLVPVAEWWFDEVHADYSANYSPDNIAKLRSMIRQRQTNYYMRTDTWLYEAMSKFPVKDKSVLVYGSENPWYEVMAQEFGAKEVVVCEYNDRDGSNVGVKYLKPHELGDREFDCAFSISSFEHDGLGRYGDPLNPYGDFDAMLAAKKSVRAGGLMFLAVPVGSDMLVWNAHRVYGQFRLPALFSYWQLEGSFGFSESDYAMKFGDITGTSCHQPVFVLRNAV